MRERFEKITEVNGFDAADPNNARQNNYAWSMAEMGDYLYVGTGRNIVYSVIKSGEFPGLEVPEVFVPDPVDMKAEIWRYKKGRTGDWSRVYKDGSSPFGLLGIVGFRFMIPYVTRSGPNAGTALYTGGATFAAKIAILKSEDGVNWQLLDTGSVAGDSTRAMVEYRGKLYLGTMEALGGGTKTLLYATGDPSAGWEKINTVGNPNKNPRGEIASMVSFGGHLYVGTALPGGFEVWRTRNREPALDDWELIVDKGAGDALYEIPVSMEVFKKNIYVGTAIWFGVASIDPDRRYVPPKGFDVIKIHDNDSWDVIVGGEPLVPTSPVTGSRKPGRYLSGFGDISNAYCWQLRRYGKELYLGTWDWSVLLPPLLSSLFKANSNFAAELIAWLGNPANYAMPDNSYPVMQIARAVIMSLSTFPFAMGADLYRSSNGKEWEKVVANGLGNPCNYGVRTLLASADGNLYLGTANPFQGCEVWAIGPIAEAEEDDE
jgi:hypothetical protein